MAARGDITAIGIAVGPCDCAAITDEEQLNITVTTKMELALVDISA